jgi:uncharacterized damage-inducible protein DinB
MTPAERERALAHLEKTREQYRRLAQTLSRSQLHYKPASDQWSVAQALEHITIVEGRVLDRIHTALQQPPTASKSTMEDGHLVQVVAGRTGKLKAPEPVVPTGRWPEDRLFEEFDLVRNRSVYFARTTNADLRQHGFPHPFFGELDCYQWLLLIPAHCQRHLAQATEVMADPHFPRAAAS